MPENATLQQKRTTQEVFRADVNQVTSEIRRRGGNATLTKGLRARVRAGDADHSRTVEIRVKAKTTGTWQASTDDGRPGEEPQGVDQYWVLVDLGQDPAEFYIAPAGWMKRDIETAHREYLDRHGGRRAQNDESKHHAIRLNRVEQWEDRWDILGIFST